MTLDKDLERSEAVRELSKTVESKLIDNAIYVSQTQLAFMIRLASDYAE